MSVFSGSVPQLKIGTRFLDSLIFNDEVDAYQSWTLFLIFASILVLISGVVLLTHKKPEPIGNAAVPLARNKSQSRGRRKLDDEEDGGSRQGGDGEQEVLWSMGDHDEQDDDESESGDEDAHRHLAKHGLGLGEQGQQSSIRGKGKDRIQTKKSRRAGRRDEEGIRLIGETREDEEEGWRAT